MQIVQNPKVLELLDFPTWEDGVRHLLDTWEELRELLGRPDALEGIVWAYHSRLIPKADDTQLEKLQLVFLELLLQSDQLAYHDSSHEHHNEGVETRYQSYLSYKLWDKYMAGYEREYFTVWPEHGVRQDRIPYFYSAYPAMAYRAAVTRGYQSKRADVAPPGPVEDMSTAALVQVMAHAPDGVKIWNNSVGGQFSGDIKNNWYAFVRETDAARELMMFRQDAPQEILRYYQSLHLTDERFDQFINPMTVCELFLRQELVGAGLSREELGQRDRAFAEKYMEKLCYRKRYSQYRNPLWLAYEDMRVPLQVRYNGCFTIGELRMMPYLALQVIQESIS